MRLGSQPETEAAWVPGGAGGSCPGARPSLLTCPLASDFCPASAASPLAAEATECCSMPATARDQGGMTSSRAVPGRGKLPVWLLSPSVLHTQDFCGRTQIPLAFQGTVMELEQKVLD